MSELLAVANGTGMLSCFMMAEVFCEADADASRTVNLL
jgi:hypothetical protein